MAKHKFKPLSKFEKKVYLGVVIGICLFLSDIVYELVQTLGTNEIPIVSMNIYEEIDYNSTLPSDFILNAMTLETGNPIPFSQDLITNGCGLNRSLTDSLMLEDCHVHILPVRFLNRSGNINSEYQSRIPLDSKLYLSKSSFKLSNQTLKLLQQKPLEYPKYFIGYGHIDQRFRSKTRLHASMRSYLIDLFGAWSLFADQNQIPYWIAHGNLLGWYWGERAMPWDDDIDIQVPANTLFDLKRFHGRVYLNRYLFELNPYHLERRYDGNNIIDARLIDIQSGFFIDITGVTNFDNKLLCKNLHEYSFDDIFPLTRISYDGILSWRPNKVEKILTKEYGAQSTIVSLYRVILI
ncbi:LicD family-domain-containing protein [Globomyces pollinis-pini]|nr:LicD family-domain-containing protein [Globomyces pollinis-pini]